MAKKRASHAFTPQNALPSLSEIHENIINCAQCSRLRQHCNEVARTKRKAYLTENYWGRPVPGFGVENARLCLLGLAPAAHGANRTGRIFTGDRSGEWLYRALFKAGFANQPESHHLSDGLTLHDCYITCTVKCAPPDNKPSPEEIKECSEHLKLELQTLTKVKVFVALGQIAYQTLWPLLTAQATPETSGGTLKKPRTSPRPEFKHGKKIRLPDQRWLILSYHPSQQNTFTGRLTEPMFDEIFETAQSFIQSDRREDETQ